MSGWEDALKRARQGDMDAFASIVRQFQDMAVGYAYALLGSFPQAQDAAQEAFVRVYLDLAKLRKPKAFPAWLRRIIFTQCNRLTRSKHVQTVPLEKALQVASTDPDSMDRLEQQKKRDQVLDAIRELPHREREATTLYYINGYSQAEVGEFLEIPTSTVKSRLHSARRRLRERVVAMVRDELKSDRAHDSFANDVVKRINQVEVHICGKDSMMLLLTDDSKRYMSIIVGAIEGKAIEPWLEERGPRNGLDSYTSLISGLQRFDCVINRFCVNALKDSTLYGILEVRTNMGRSQVDCRPSDGLNLAVRAQAPIFIDHKAADSIAWKGENGQLLKRREVEKQIARFRPKIRRQLRVPALDNRPLKTRKALLKHVQQITKGFGYGGLLRLESLTVVSQGRRTWWILEPDEGRAMALRLTRAQKRLTLFLIRENFPRPMTNALIYDVICAAGLKLEASVLHKRGRRGVEASLIVGDGTRREAIPVTGAEGIAIAFAGKCPILLTEALGEKLYVRDEEGRSLSTEQAVRLYSKPETT